MNPLQVRLLGPGGLTQDGQLLTAHSVKAIALLAYLVVEADRPHTRSKLAALLWPDLPEAAARQGLRQAVYALRSAGSGQLARCLHVEKDVLRWTGDEAVDVDLGRFLSAVQGLHEPDWLLAAAIPWAPLLEGRSLAPCNDYMAWLAAVRERLHALCLHNLDRLVCSGIARCQWEAVQVHAQALVALDPASESAFRHLARILAARGRRHELRAAWQRLVERLRAELDVEPTVQTVELYRMLAGRDEAAPASSGARDAAAPGPLPAGLRSGDEVDALVRAGRAAERVYAFAQAVDLYDRALRVLRRAAGGDGLQPLRRQCELLLLKDAALERLGNRAAQLEALEQALAVAETLGDNAITAALLLRRAGAGAYQGRTGQAVDDARRAGQLYRALADQPGEAEALRELGFVHWRALQPLEALEPARQALQLHRRMGDITGEASALHNLSEIHRSLGQYRQASDGFDQAMQLHWASGNRSGEILSLFGWAHTQHQAGDDSGALRQYRAALALAEQSGELTMQARALHALAMHHALLGELEPGLALLLRAIEIDRAIGYAHALGHDLSDLAELHQARGERAQGRAALQEALVWFGFTEDVDAITACRQRLHEQDAGQPPAQPPWQRWVKSHLALGEGKAYCEFESGRLRAAPALPAL